MEIIRAILLGIVEGLTEFLPISSTGHLIVAQDALNFYDSTKLFTVVIQIGAILAVVWFYRQGLVKLVRGLIEGDKDIRRFWLVWITATIPAGVAGLLFDQQIEAYATTSTVAISLIVGGVAIWLIENFYTIKKSGEKEEFKSITTKQALIIGCYQVLALIPGVSRSGATIIGGVLTGQDRLTATAFSFYLGMPILLLAGTFKLVTEDLSTVEGGLPTLVIGTIVSFITALFVVKWLLKYVSKHSFRIFAYYRIIFGIFLLGLLYLDVLS